ncbi:MAG: hypothetical protein PVJ47_10035 [Thiohalocapsa sp.]
MARDTAVTAKTKSDSPSTTRRETMKRSGSLEHSGLFRKKPARQQIVISPGGRRASREPVTEAQRAALARRRRVEAFQEEAELAQVAGEVWDESP